MRALPCRVFDTSLRVGSAWCPEVLVGRVTGRLATPRPPVAVPRPLVAVSLWWLILLIIVDTLA